MEWSSLDDYEMWSRLKTRRKERKKEEKKTIIVLHSLRFRWMKYRWYGRNYRFRQKKILFNYLLRYEDERYPILFNWRMTFVPFSNQRTAIIHHSEKQESK